MSEYIEIEAEATDDPDIMILQSNLVLADGERESYDSAAAMEEGSPLAQALAVIPGISSLVIDGGAMTVTGDGDTPWHIIIADISAAVKDFFL